MTSISSKYTQYITYTYIFLKIKLPEEEVFRELSNYLAYALIEVIFMKLFGKVILSESERY